MFTISVWGDVKTESIIFKLVYFSIHVSTDDQNFGFWNKSRKEKQLIIEGNDVWLIDDIRGTVT